MAPEAGSMVQIGSVVNMKGQVFADHGDGVRPLSPGAPVHQGEVILTKAGANVEIKFLDDTVLSEGENSNLRLDSYVFDPAKGGNLLFNMAEGTFRVVTGKIADNNPENFKLKSPLATIGIRGTTVVSEIRGGVEKHGAEEIHAGKALTIQNALGQVQLVTSSRGMVDFRPDGSMGATRPFSVQEIQHFQSVTPIQSVPTFTAPPPPPQSGGQQQGQQQGQQGPQQGPQQGGQGGQGGGQEPAGASGGGTATGGSGTLVATSGGDVGATVTGGVGGGLIGGVFGGGTGGLGQSALLVGAGATGGGTAVGGSGGLLIGLGLSQGGTGGAGAESGGTATGGTGTGLLFGPSAFSGGTGGGTATGNTGSAVVNDEAEEKNEESQSGGGSGGGSGDGTGQDSQPDTQGVARTASAPGATLTGTAYGDTLTGIGGRSLLQGLGGGDTLIGGSWDPRTMQGDIADYSWNSSGIYANLALGTAVAGDSRDSLANLMGVRGSSGNDTLIGNGHSYLEGGAGNDTLYGANEIDGSGTDSVASYLHASGGVTVVLDAGTTIVTDSHGDTASVSYGTSAGADGHDLLFGISKVIGSASADMLIGTDHSDNWFQGGGGADSIIGGNGHNALGERLIDTISFEDQSHGVFVDLANTLMTGGDAVDQFSGIEGVDGTTLGDTLIGDSGNNWFMGNGGSDTIDGGGHVGAYDGVSYSHMSGAVTVDLATGSAVYSGGQDTLVGINEAEGSQYGDTLIGAENEANWFQGDLGDDLIAAGSRTKSATTYLDIASYEDATGGVTVDLSLTRETTLTYTSGGNTLWYAVGDHYGTATGADGHDTLLNIEGVSGSKFADRIIGGAETAFVMANAGDDTVAMGTHFTDQMVIDGGAGTDTLTFTSDGSTTYNLQNVIYVEKVVLGDADTSIHTNMTTGLTGTLTIDASALDGHTLAFNGSGEATMDFSILGGAGADALTLGQAGNTVDAGAGNDSIKYLGAPTDNYGQTAWSGDMIDGGADDDSLTYTDADNFSSSGELNGVSHVEHIVIKGTNAYVTPMNDLAPDSGSVTIDASALSGGLHFDGSHQTSGLVISGGAGSDFLTGGSGLDSVYGGSGNDTFYGSTGDDFLSGGVGANTLDYSGLAHGVSLAFTGADWGTLYISDSVDHQQFYGFTNVLGSDRADSLWGGSGLITLDGGGGNDTLGASGSSASLSGGTGNDLFQFGTAVSTGVTIDGGLGDDTLAYTASGDSLTLTDLDHVTGVEHIVISGADAYAAPASDLAPDNGAVTIDGTALTGTLTFDASHQASGLVLLGSGQGDSFTFGTLGSSDSAPTIDGGAGFDTLTFYGDATSNSNDAALNHTTQVEKVVIKGWAASVRPTAALTPDGGAITIDGSQVQDHLAFDGSAQSANLFIQGSQGSNTLIGGSGNDSITGNEGNDTITGHGGADTIDAGAGTNVIAFDGAADGNPLAGASITGTDGSNTLLVRSTTDLTHVAMSGIGTLAIDGPATVTMTADQIAGGGFGLITRTGDGGATLRLNADTATTLNLSGFSFDGWDTLDTVVVNAAGNENLTSITTANEVGKSVVYAGTSLTGITAQDLVNEIHAGDGGSNITLSHASVTLSHDTVLGGTGDDDLWIRSENSLTFAADSTLDGGGGENTLIFSGGQNDFIGFDFSPGHVANFDSMQLLGHTSATLSTTNLHDMGLTFIGGEGSGQGLVVKGDGATNAVDLSGIEWALWDSNTLVVDCSGCSTGQTITGANVAGTIFGGSGADTIHVSQASDVVHAGLGNDTVVIGAGANFSSNAILDGGGGANTLLLMDGADFSSASLSDFQHLVFAVNGSTATFNASQIDLMPLTVSGTAGGDFVNILGDMSVVDVNALVHASGWDTQDRVTVFGSGTQNTTITGLDGANNWLHGGAGAYSYEIHGGAGASAHNTLVGGAGTDSLVAGNNAHNTVSYELDTSGVTVNLSGNWAFADVDLVRVLHGGMAEGDTLHTTDPGYFDEIIGGSGNDKLTAGDWATTLSGHDGADSLKGGTGDDIISGGTGDDTVSGGDGHDVLDGGGHSSGNWLDYSYASTGLTLTLNGEITATASLSASDSDTVGNFQHVIGTSGNDTITGDAAHNILEGGAGNDILDGGSGLNTASYAHATAGVVVHLDSGSTLISPVGSHSAGECYGTASGGAGSDYLFNVVNITGSSHTDTLVGNANANVINGGAGADTLTGGGGNDIFYISSPDDLGGGKTITDFTSHSGAAGEQDVLRFDHTAFGFSGTGELAAGSFFDPSGYASSGGASPCFIYDQGTGVLQYDGDGYSGSSAAQTVATLTGGPDLDHTDIHLS